MKTIAVLLLGFFVVGCAPYPTYEQLEDEAMLTGNWSKVERRERAMLRTGMRTQTQCDIGFIAMCQNEIGDVPCTCVSHEVLGGALASW